MICHCEPLISLRHCEARRAVAIFSPTRYCSPLLLPIIASPERVQQFGPDCHGPMGLAMTFDPLRASQ